MVELAYANIPIKTTQKHVERPTVLNTQSDQCGSKGAERLGRLQRGFRGRKSAGCACTQSAARSPISEIMHQLKEWSPQALASAGFCGAFFG